MFASLCSLVAFAEKQSPQRAHLTPLTLFAVIDETHTGTMEDPIPYDWNMELFLDMYYVQDDVMYKCVRNSGAPMYHALKDLIGTYVEVVN